MWYLVGIQHDTSSAQAPSSKPRMHHLDTLRSCLTTLVILHHIAIAYGGEGIWYYTETTKKNPFLTLFVALNQSYFMGAFFVLSSFFASQSLSRVQEREGLTDSHASALDPRRVRAAMAFYRGRLLRLGLPLLIYTVFGHAVTLACATRQPFTPAYYAQYLADLIARPGVRGPPWYLALLLLLDAVYALASACNLQLSVAKLPKYAPPLVLLGTALASCLWRSACSPIGFFYKPLNLHAAYLPQYLLAYATGLLFAARQDLLAALVRSRPSRALALFFAVSAIVAIGSGLLRDASPLYKRALSPQVALYAAWNELGFAVLTHTALWAAARWGCKESMQDDPRQRGVCRLAYAAFLLHPIPATALPVYFADWHADALLKTAVVGSAAVAASFSGAWLLLAVPGARRIL